MAEYRAKAYFFQKVKNLQKLPMKELNRKFLLIGKKRVGKTRAIQQIYDRIAMGPQFPDRPSEFDDERRDWVLPEGYKYKEYAWVEHNTPAIAGFKTGDLRLFDYEKA